MYESSTGYQTYAASSGDPALYGAVSAGILIFFLIIFVISYVVTALFLSMIFKKAGEPAWAAWVPVYNNWKLLEMGGQQGFWAILSLVPIANIAAVVFLVIAMYHIGLNFGKEGIFVLLAIFLPIVWLIWLAVDPKAVWKGGQGAATAVPAQPTPPTQFQPPTA